MSELKQAGHLDIKGFVIYNRDRSKSIDLKHILHAFSIHESMSKSSTRGKATLYDANNILARLPIKGEEFLQIVYEDFFGVERNENYYVYAVTNIALEDNNESIQSFEIHFVSLAKFLSEKFEIQKSYNARVTPQGLISEYVKDVYDEYYAKQISKGGMQPKEIVIEDTDGPQDLIVPNYSPDQTMKFFSRRAYNANSKTQSFRFFENREKYYFATNDFMERLAKGNIGYGTGLIDPNLAEGAGLGTGKTIPVFTRSYMASNSGKDQLRLMYELIDVRFGEKVNTVEEIHQGAYRNRFVEIDILNGTTEKIEYDYSKEFNEADQDLIHTADYVNEHAPKWKTRYTLKDYSSIGAPTGYGVRSNPFYPEIINTKTSYFAHYHARKVEATVYGRNTLFAGDRVTLNLIEPIAADQNREKDKENSGDYFVESIDNVFYENTFKQNLILARVGIGK